MLSATPEFVGSLAQYVPAFAGPTLYGGPSLDTFRASLADRAHTVVDTEGAGPFDCVVRFVQPEEAENGGTVIRDVARALGANGCALFVLLPGAGAQSLESIAQWLGTEALALYRHHTVSTAGSADGGQGYIAFAVRSTYNPLLHARDLMMSGHADWAFDVLVHIPAELQTDPQIAARIAAEKLVCLLAWDRAAGEKDRLARFFFSQATFYNAVAVAPAAREVYLCHGEFWRRIGDVSMRQRLLRSVFHVAPVAESQQVEILEGVTEPPRRTFTPPAWRAPAKLPRVLFVMHPRPHYGLDVQYYGLCEVLGDANVVEFPYKPTLHGAKPAELAHYPCMFNRAGTPLLLDEVVTQLRRGEFDLVIYGDLEAGIDSSAAKTIVSAAGNIPVVLFDAQDDPLDQWAKMNEFVGGGLRLYFKREMLACWDYGEHTVPMPFAYADERIPSLDATPRNEPLFWAGHRQFGLRRLYLEQIESLFGMDLNKSYSQDEYSAALRGARIGLNIFGFGFDTVRYWEIPAHGAMLLAERLPIYVPLDFVDGESAVFFDDLPELEDRLTYWMAHGDEAARIAARGREHLLRHHTASARARQMLGWVQARVEGWGR
ncbi:MAG: glycosyltransferase family 1 protein [Candidatus Hydrogenedentes bacterium]|nr:glycosyltransferase family 1 protein [Candidatus Hydrogenedentota bacterium]